MANGHNLKIGGPMGSSDDLKRVAFSPGEFAALFGKSQTWGYRQIYAGKVKAITEHGRILIPANEVEKILGTAEIYSGRPTPAVKARLEKLKPEQVNVWRLFVNARREGKGKDVKTGKLGAPGGGGPREAVLARLAARRNNPG